MMNYTEDLRKFRTLQLDTSELEKRAALLVEIDKSLVARRRELAALRPANKDFQGELTRLSGLINALDSAMAGAKDDVNEAIEDLKTKALEAGAPQLPQVVTRIRDLDRRAVTLLLDLRQVLIDRDAATVQADESFSILAEFARETGADPGGTSWDCPGGDRWPGHGKAYEAYTRRFASMVQAGLPEGDPLQWFSRRRW